MAVVSRPKIRQLVFHERCKKQWNKLSDAQLAAAYMRFREIAEAYESCGTHPAIHTLGENKPELPRAFYTDVTHNKRNTRVFFTLEGGLLCIFMIEDGYDNTSRVRGKTEEMARRSLTFRRDIRDGQRLISGPPTTPPPRVLEFMHNATHPVQQPLPAVDQAPAAPPQEEPAELAAATATTAPAKEEEEEMPAESPKFATTPYLPSNGTGYPDAMTLRALAKYAPAEWPLLNDVKLPNSTVSTGPTGRRRIDSECLRRLRRAGLVEAQNPENRHIGRARVTATGRAIVESGATRVCYGPDGAISVFSDAREDPDSPTFIGRFLTKLEIVRAALECTTSSGEFITDYDLWVLLDKQDKVLVGDPQAVYSALRDLVRSGEAEDAPQRGQPKLVYRIARRSGAQQPQQQPQQQKEETTAMPTNPTPPAAPTAPVTVQATRLEATPESPRAVLVREAEAFCDTLCASFRGLTREERSTANDLLCTVEDFIARLNGAA